MHTRTGGGVRPEPIVLRPSSLTSWVDCARRSFARGYPDLVKAAGYELREVPPHCGSAVGTGVHAAAAYTLQSVVDRGEIGNEGEAVDRAIEGFRHAIEFGAAWDDVTVGPTHAEAQVRRMAEMYRREVAPRVRPDSVEKRIEAVIDDRFTLSGQADATSLEPNAIDDLKTGTMQRVHTPQIGAYSLLRRAQGHDVRKLSDTFIRRVSVKKEQPLPVVTEYPVELAEAVAYRRIQAVSRDISEFLISGDPQVLISNPDSMLCSTKFCPAHGTAFCREHRGAFTKESK